MADKPNLALDQRVLNLLRFNFTVAEGDGHTATFTFPTSFFITTRSAFSDVQKDAARLAAGLWDDVSGLDLRELSGDARIRMYNDTGISGAGRGGPSSQEAGPNGTFNTGHPFVELNPAITPQTASPVVGQYSFLVLLHEMGHSLGLSHPQNYPSATPNYDTDATYAEDTMQYTLMSYFYDSPSRGTNFLGVQPQTPMMDDIAALQKLYGVSPNTRLGDTVYGFNSTADRSVFNFATNARPVLTIVDSGGADTIDLSGFSMAQLLDLNAGRFSNVGGLTGNVGISHSTTVENGLGGGGADVIVGNAQANELRGNAGADTITAGGGADTVYGGVGNDVIGDTTGANYLRGDEGDDSISGGDQFDDINGNMGADTAQGGLGNDWVVGGKDDDQLFGEGGDDLVYGNFGADTCDGGAGADIVRGGQQDDVLRGGEGNDYLSGDRDNDTIAGGAGADIFHSFGEAGLDRIVDFNRGDGDVVLLDAGTQYTVAQVGLDTVIDMTGGGRVVLMGVAMSTLTGGWIVVG